MDELETDVCFLAVTLVPVVHGKDMIDSHAKYAVLNSKETVFQKKFD
jgi:hypothetical protein